MQFGACMQFGRTPSLCLESRAGDRQGCQGPRRVAHTGFRCGKLDFGLPEFASCSAIDAVDSCTTGAWVPERGCCYEKLQRELSADSSFSRPRTMLELVREDWIRSRAEICSQHLMNSHEPQNGDQQSISRKSNSHVAPTKCHNFLAIEGTMHGAALSIVFRIGLAIPPCFDVATPISAGENSTPSTLAAEIVRPASVSPIALAETIADEEEACYAAPTTKCLVHLSVNLAKTIDQHVSRARILGKLGKTQARIAEIQEARSTLSVAFEAATVIPSKRDRAKILVEIAKARAYAGDSEGVRNTIAVVVEAVQDIRRARERINILTEAAKAQSQSGDTQSARKTLSMAIETANNLPRTEKTLIEIGLAQAEIGDIRGAKETFASLREMAEKVEDAQLLIAMITSFQARALAKGGDVPAALEAARTFTRSVDRVQLLIEIAKIRVAASDEQGAGDALTEAGDVARAIPGKRNSANALSEISKVLEVVGDAQGARNSRIAAAEAARSAIATEPEPIIDLRGGRWHVRFLIGYSKLQAMAGDAQSARDTLAQVLSKASELTNTSQRNRAFIGVAKAHAEIGDSQGARKIFSSLLETAKALPSSYMQAHAFSDIAKAQIESGDLEGGRNTLASALKAVKKTSGKTSRDTTLATIAEVLTELAR